MTDVTKKITPNFTASFPAVFSPKEFNGKEKYSVVMVFDNDTDLSSLKDMVRECAVGKWGKVPKPFKTPFRDGNEKDLEKYPTFEDTTFVSAGSLYQPGLVDQKRQPIIDESEFYAGCIARASVTCYPWEFQGKKGVSFNLVNVQKVSDGTKLGGRTDASDEFGELPSDDDSSSEEYGADDI